MGKWGTFVDRETDRREEDLNCSVKLLPHSVSALVAETTRRGTLCDTSILVFGREEDLDLNCSNCHVAAWQFVYGLAACTDDRLPVSSFFGDQGVA